MLKYITLKTVYILNCNDILQYYLFYFFKKHYKIFLTPILWMNLST